MQLEQHPNPNFSSRYYPYTKPNLIIVHWTDGPDLATADKALRDRGVSAHYGIDSDSVWQWVAEDKVAYHAGNWIANLRSVGIEHVGMPGQPIKDETYQTSAQLIVGICARYGITPNDQTIQPHRNFRATDCPGQISEGGLDIPRLLQTIDTILHPPAPVDPHVVQPGPEQDNGAVGITFPKLVTIIVKEGVNVRVSPNHTAALGGSKHLKFDDVFTAVALVTGDDPYQDGRNQWYQSTKGNFVWAGACQ